MREVVSVGSGKLVFREPFPDFPPDLHLLGKLEVELRMVHGRQRSLDRIVLVVKDVGPRGDREAQGKVSAIARTAVRRNRISARHMRFIETLPIGGEGRRW